jgi:glycosyltransferase involved in cell wall biosynthesis
MSSMSPKASSDAHVGAGADDPLSSRSAGRRGIPADAAVSVVIPAWNAADYLRRAIESVLRQTVRPRQIIVVDDGSTDNTAALVADYGSAATCFQQAHQGLSVARNEGVARSASDWVAFLDADDEWLPTKLERQLAILGDYPALHWCSCHRKDVGVGRRTDFARSASMLALLYERPILPLVAAMAAGLSVAPSGIVAHRALLRESGGFDPSLCYSQDRDLWLRIARHHPWIGYSPEVGVHYHFDTPDSLMKRIRDRTEALDVVCRHLETWRAAGDDAFHELGRRLIVEYLIRSASGEVSIDAATQDRAKHLARLSLPERFLLASLAVLPAPLARKVGSRLARRPRRRQAVPRPPPEMQESSRVLSRNAP